MESDEAQKKSVLADLNRWHLLLAGYTETEVVGLGDLSQLSAEQISKHIHSKKLEAMNATGEALTKEGVKTVLIHPRTKRKPSKRKSRKHRTRKK